MNVEIIVLELHMWDCRGHSGNDLLSVLLTRACVAVWPWRRIQGLNNVPQSQELNKQLT